MRIVRTGTRKERFSPEEQKALKAGNIHWSFPPQALQEADQARTLIKLADRPRVKAYSIDTRQALEIDDAIWVERTPAGFRAQVSIADVPSLVPDGSAIDREAQHRTATIYLPGAVFPMVPNAINELCGLDQGKISPAITFELDYDRTGSLLAFRPFLSSVVNQVALSYAQAEVYRTNRAGEVAESLAAALELTMLIFQRRNQVGAPQIFDLDKGVATNEDGILVHLNFREKYPSYLIVRELMIAANAGLAAHMVRHDYPFLFRSHLPGEGGREFRAFYSPDNAGHSALGLSAYGHATSPLRRYPDVVNLRLLTLLLGGFRFEPEARAGVEEQLRPIGLRCGCKPGIVGAAIGKIFQTRAAVKNAGDRAHLLSLKGNELSVMLKSLLRLEGSDLSTVLSVLAEKGAAPSDLARMVRAYHDRPEIREYLDRWLSGPGDFRSVLNIVRDKSGWNREKLTRPDESGVKGQPPQELFGRRMEVEIDGRALTTREPALGRNRKEAEHEAARLFLVDYLTKELVPPDQVDNSRWGEIKPADVKLAATKKIEGPPIQYLFKWLEVHPELVEPGNKFKEQSLGDGKYLGRFVLILKTETGAPGNEEVFQATISRKEGETINRQKLVGRLANIIAGKVIAHLRNLGYDL
jgi:hypothetical protein